MSYTKTLSVFLVFIFCFGQKIAAQWKAISYEQTTEKVWYDLLKDERFSPQQGYYFPAYDLEQFSLLQAYVLSDPGSSQLNDLPPGCCGNAVVTAIQFPQALNLATDLAKLSARILARNIRHIDVYFHDEGHERWYVNRFRVPFGGYQIPWNEAISEWELVAQTSVHGGTGESVQEMGPISKMLIVSYPGNEGDPMELAFGDLKIWDKKWSEKDAKHPFFNNLFTGRKDNAKFYQDYSTWSLTTGLEDSPIVFSTIGEFGEAYLSGKTFFQKTAADASEVQLLHKLLQLSLEQYPFYQERNLNKDKISDTYLKLWTEKTWENEAICEFSAKVSSFIDQEFSDGHFKLTLSDECRTGKRKPRLKSGPIRLYNFGEDLYIAAVLDSTYQKQIPLGSRVLEIDHQRVRDLFHPRELSSPAASKALFAKLLRKAADDSTQIKTIDPEGAVNEAIIHYDRPLQIPSGFRPKHCEFTFSEDGIAYFRINTWREDVYLRLLNHWEQIKTAKGLILDIRANGGGELMAMLRVLSLFIDQPVISSHYQTKDFTESLVVGPNRHYQYPKDKPILVLADANTACASEEFLMAVRENGKAKFIGSTPTAGALATAFDFEFPSGMELRLNSILGKNTFNNYQSIENKGIEPDIWLARTHVLDLAPYRDKLLRYAERYLKAW